MEARDQVISDARSGDIRPHAPRPAPRGSSDGARAPAAVPTARGGPPGAWTWVQPSPPTPAPRPISLCYKYLPVTVCRIFVSGGLPSVFMGSVSP